MAARCFLTILVIAIMTICLTRNMGVDGAAVISIDFSSEWIKIALVKPGVPMEIVLNKESKRKTAAVVALRNDERSFSESAATTAVKYPKTAYRYVQFLAGLAYDNPLVAQYKKWFPFYDIREDPDRGAIIFNHDENIQFTPEELMGMLLNYSRELAQDYARTSIRDAIITIPAFFNQAQRRAVLQAAQLVGLNVLQLMTDGAAVALNFGLFRQNTFNTTPFYIMFYDMGSTSTIATIAEYKKVQVKEGSTAHIHPQVRIRGVGFDRTLGGLEMEMRLRDHLAKIFTSKHKTTGKITDSPRAMAKLLKEAKRVKTVLSANTEIFAQVEGLFEDVDFSTKVTRSEFEDLCEDLFDRIDDPINQALKVSDITMNEIESVILVGGGTRVPKVQEMLLKAINRQELGKNINTDEAAALGAVYQGASLTKLFRVKKFIIKDANVYPIEVSFDRQAVDSEGNSYTKPVTRVLFNSANPYPQKKLLTFNRHSSDFDFAVSYGNVGFLTDAERKYLGPHNLTKVRLEGVEEAIRDNPEGDPDGIKVHFRMDESGLLLLDSMESLFQYPVVEEESTFSKLKNAFSNFFTGSEEEGEGGEKANASVDSENNLETEQEGNKGNKEENIQEKSNDDEQQKQDEQKLEEPQQENTEKEEVDKEQVESEEKEKEETDTGEQKTAEEEEVTSDDKDKEEEQPPLQEEDVQETVPSEEEEVNNQDEEGEEASEQTTPTVDSNATNSSINETTPASGPVRKKVKKDGSVKMQTVKVNLTSLVTRLDLIQMSDKEFNASRTKLDWLQKRDEDKRENERQKNNLESHIFETQDKMHSEEVQAHSTEEERTSILDALRIASEWMDDDGYAAETDTYRQKLRELKRLSKPVFRRMNEAKKQPRVMAELLASLNRSYGMVMYMKNISEEEIFTKVEMKTLEDLTLETLAWYRETEGQFNDTKPYQDPPVLSSDVEEKTKKLDREVYYLINKIKNYRPKTKPKDTGNTTSSKKPFKSKPVVINGTTDTDEEGTADTGEGTMDSADTLNDETPVEQPIPDTASSSEPIKDDPDDVSSNEDRAGLPSSSDEDHQEL